MGHQCLQLLEQTACGPQSSSPVLTPRSCTKRGIPGPVSPPAHSRSDLPVPPDPVQLERGAWTLLAPLIPQVQGPSCVLWGSYSPYPRPGPSQARWAGFIARSASWCSGGCHVESVPLYGQLSLIVIVCSLGAQQTAGRHPLHWSRLLPSHMAHSYSKLKI